MRSLRVVSHEPIILCIIKHKPSNYAWSWKLSVNVVQCKKRTVIVLKLGATKIISLIETGTQPICIAQEWWMAWKLPNLSVHGNTSNLDNECNMGYNIIIRWLFENISTYSIQLNGIVWDCLFTRRGVCIDQTGKHRFHNFLCYVSELSIFVGRFFLVTLFKLEKYNPLTRIWRNYQQICYGKTLSYSYLTFS